MVSQNEVRFLIRQGDVLFDNVATHNEAYNSQHIREACHRMLQVLDFDVPDMEQFDRESDLDNLLQLQCTSDHALVANL